jgi:preprotein translocase subunit SecD
MLINSRARVYSALIICFLMALFALPSMLSEKTLESLPDWMPKRKISLGLDLQGGSHLLLQVEMDEYVKTRITAMNDDVRNQMRAEKIQTEAQELRGNTVRLKFADDATRSTAKDSLRETLGTDVSYSEEDGNTLVVSYTDAYIREMRNRLLEQSIEIVDRRVNESGTKEPIIQRQGDNRIVLQVPGLTDPANLKALLGQTANMTFHMVNESVSPTDAAMGNVPAGTLLLPADDPKERYTNGEAVRYPVLRRALLTGDMLVNAQATFDGGRPVVSFKFDTKGARLFGKITTDNIGKRFAIVLDGKVITAPVIQSAIINGSGVIQGSFTVESANNLALLLRAGALPAPLKVIEERNVGPSLGTDSIDAGSAASILGIALVIGFMFLSYGLFGLFANVALMVNLVFIIAILSFFQATLTLPGIAGIVLTLGMAVDANVLIYERIREELRAGRTVFSAIETGFRAATNTIIDSNLTSLIAAFMLFYFGTGSVKGFAVALMVGIICSFYTATTLTKIMVVAWVRRARPKTLSI